MATGDPPAVARRRLRRALRRSREEVGLTQGEVAKALEWSISKVNRIETGEVTISNTDLQALLRLLGVVESEVVERHLEDGRTARRRSWWDDSKYREFNTPETLQLVQYEIGSTAIRIFQPAIVPGILQTSEYASSVIGAVIADMSSDAKVVRHEVRMRRQSQLWGRSNPPSLLIVLDEFVPMRTIGTSATMLGQLEALLEVAGRPNVHIRMLPREEASFTLLGGFSIYDLDDDENAVLYREGAASLEQVDASDTVLKYRRRFEQMWNVSLNEDATSALIEARRATIWAETNRNPQAR